MIHNWYCLLGIEELSAKFVPLGGKFGVLVGEPGGGDPGGGGLLPVQRQGRGTFLTLLLIKNVTHTM